MNVESVKLLLAGGLHHDCPDSDKAVRGAIRPCLPVRCWPTLGAADGCRDDGLRGWRSGTWHGTVNLPNGVTFPFTAKLKSQGTKSPAHWPRSRRFQPLISR